MVWRLSLFFPYQNLLLPKSETTQSDDKLIHTEVLNHIIIRVLFEFLGRARHHAKRHVGGGGVTEKNKRVKDPYLGARR